MKQKWQSFSDAQKGTLAGIVSACCFAGYLLMNRYIFTEFGVKALDYAFLFNALAGLFAGVSLARLLGSGKLTKLKENCRGIVLLCALGLAGMLTLVVGQNYTTSIHASLLVTTSIISTMYFSGIFLRERITTRQSAWVVCMFAGLYIAIVGLRAMDLQSGDVIILVGVLFFGLGNVLSRSLMQKHGPDIIPDVRIFGVGIVAAAVYIVFFRSIDVISAIGFWTLLSALLFWLTMKTFSLSVHLLDANHAVVLVNAQIIPASIAGVVLLSEGYTWEKLIGSVIVLISIYFITQKGVR